MDIRSIKDRANEVLIPYKTQLTRVLTIVLFLGCIPNLVSSDNAFLSILSTVLLLIFIPVSHGTIVAALKIVRNSGEEVSDDDAFVGFKRFKELFPTYMAMTFVTFLILLAFGLIAGIFLVAVFSQSINDAVQLSTSASVETLIYILFSGQPMNLLVVILVFLGAMIVGFLIDAFLMAVPYLLEQYHITGFKAIKLSYQMMKNHLIDYIKLFFSFFGWMFLIAIVEALLSKVIPFGIVVSVIVGLLRIFTYLPHFTLSQTVLFEEIAYYHFH